MKLSLLLFALFATTAAAFVPQYYAPRRAPFAVILKGTPEKEVRPNTDTAADTDERIKQEFESDENSPAKIQAAAKGEDPEAKDDEESEDKNPEPNEKRFDPLSLWTDHSSNF